MSETKPRFPWIWISLALVLGVILFYMPLMVAYIEYKTTHTDHVVQFLDRIHLKDPLGKIYEPVIQMLP